MYGDYWKLARLPFECDCDPQFYFRGPSHEAALLKLQYVVEQRKGIGLLVGGHGVGKTYLTRVLEDSLAPHCRPVVRLMFPQLSATELLSFLADQLEAEPTRLLDASQLHAIVRRLESRIATLAADGLQPLVIIDDAHLIESADVLQALALLLSACQVRGLALSVILVGLPELLAQVQRVPALHERVAVRAALRPLSTEDTQRYVRFRLQVSGVSDSMFHAEALMATAELARGIPRRINQLCDLALLVGYADHLDALTVDDLRAAADELTSVSVD
jgi:general secretion pathway protein A